MTDQLAIAAEGLRRRFGETVAVDGVDLSVPEGQIYGFLGPNGAGKTTLVRMLCTLLTPTEGHAQVAGYDIARQPEEVRLRIGVALQATALDDLQTGTELLLLQARLYGIRGRAARQRLDELRQLIDIGPALDRRTATYSGGMKRRLDLAMALVHNPDVLFLDEPTTGLDPVSRRDVWNEIRRLNRELGMTVFLTTQYLEEADQLADRVGIIDHGRIAVEGTPDELKRSVGNDLVIANVDGDAEAARRAAAALPEVDRAELRGDELSLVVHDGAAAVSPVAVALAGVAGVTVRQIALRRPTLDDVFLDLTGNRIAPVGADTELSV